MKRRTFLATTSASAAAAAAPATIASTTAAALANAPLRSIPITGRPVPELAAFDGVMVNVLETWNVPGGQCAVAKDGRIVYARGFGNVDDVTATPTAPPVSPTARFRIASSTKPFTAVAILRLLEMGRVGLDERAFDILSDLTPPPGSSVDPRLRTITVYQLLTHSAGFVYPDAAGFDPQFDGLRLAAAAFGHPYPATHTDIIRYVMGRRLGFTPGMQYTYSNLGYNILGRIIERRTGMDYRSALQKLLLDPIGIHRMALMTRTSPGARLSDEVFYFDGAQYLGGYPIYDDDLGVRSYSYGGFDGRAIDSHGGLIANAPDLVRFLNAVASSRGFQLLQPQTVTKMLARPQIPGRLTGDYYGLGWDVKPGISIMSHAGAITFGTCSVVFRLPRGITYAAVFNHLDPNIGAMVGVSVQDGLIAAAKSVKSWPSGDLSPTLV
jgi:CubicO group peptidase (beta-lactamase class C family)